MLGGLVIGAVLGLVAGFGIGWLVFKRPAPAAPAPSEPAVPAPPPEPEPPPDDEVKRTLDATQGLLDDLESRYRDAKPRGPDEGGVPPSAPKRRRPPAKR